MTLDLQPLLLTLKISLISTPLLFLLCVPLAYAITFSPPALRYTLQALVNLPLVLPPTVLGFYLLLAFSPESFPGAFLEDTLGFRLAFTQAGLILGSLVFSMPFMVNPIVSGLESLPPVLSEEARMLGAGRWQTLFMVLLPDIKPSLLAAGVLTFSHTLGEFGVALMIGGKIPGRTLLASMAVYDEVESLRFASAHAYAGILAAVSFVCLVMLFAVNRRWYRPF
jgi:molybdate transport system permease protein